LQYLDELQLEHSSEKKEIISQFTQQIEQIRIEHQTQINLLIQNHQAVVAAAQAQSQSEKEVTQQKWQKLADGYVASTLARTKKLSSANQTLAQSLAKTQAVSDATVVELQSMKQIVSSQGGTPKPQRGCRPLIEGLLIALLLLILSFCIAYNLSSVNGVVVVRV